MANRQPLVSVLYRLADGQAVRLEVSLGVAHALQEEDNRAAALARQDRRHLDLSDYEEGKTESRLLDRYADLSYLMERLESYAQLHNAVAKLPDIQRRRIIAYFFEGYCCKEIAMMEGVRHQSISASIRKALKTLKKILGEPCILDD